MATSSQGKTLDKRETESLIGSDKVLFANGNVMRPAKGSRDYFALRRRSFLTVGRHVQAG